MKKDGTYTIVEDSDSTASSAGQIEAMFDMFRNLDEPKKSKKKKSKKKSKLDKAYADLLKGGKKGKKSKKKHKFDKAYADLFKDGKKGSKKPKSKKAATPKKSKKRAEWELKHRLIEKSVNTALDTGSDVAKMYAESKFFPAGRKSK